MLAEPACEPRLAIFQRTEEDRLASAPQAVADCFRALSLWLVLGFIGVAGVLAVHFGPSVDSSGTGVVAQLLAATLLASGLCWANPRVARLADALGTLGLVWLAGLAGGLTSLMGLRCRLPLVDQSLLQLDRALGVDTPALVAWLAAQTQWPVTITMSYDLTVPVVCLSILAQSLVGSRIEAWRAAFCFIASLLTVCAVSILTPAKGVGLWIGNDVLAQLPNGAARYFWGSFDEFYSGSDPVLSLAAIDGVVSFPSFHAVMGLITLTLWRKSPLGFGLALAWFTQMIVGTLPLGGHYFVDLLAGAAVWAGWFWASRRLERAAAQL